ncbi:RNA-binding protein [Brooklawnia sp.]|uniref:RNA-binding protein n=1 Tax=Brooklawnia sp. TaxID=2699740 RepID=UPI00311D4156
MLAEALEHLVQGIVTHPEDVRIRDKELRHGRMLEVRVHPEDVGKVIGRQGRTASALRTVVQALAGREQIRVDFVDVDRKPGRGRH